LALCEKIIDIQQQGEKMKNIVLVGFLILLSGCSSKYAVTFDSNPQGAKIICGNTDFGYTPMTLYYDDVKEQPTLDLGRCSAYWRSGVSKKYGTVPLTKYPDGVRQTLQRPSASGYSQDAEFALKVQKMKNQQRQAQEAENAESWRQLNQSLNNLNQSLQQQTNSLQQLGSQSYRQPSFNYNNNQNAGTPMYNSDECIGAVVNGRCTGTISPDPSNVLRKKCYGTIINGECHGTIGY
jgi:hypothetical protein